MSDWYYQVMGEVVGPVSLDDLRQKVTEGEVLSETFVRQGTSQPWVPASRVDLLFPADSERLGALAIDEGREPLDDASLGEEAVLESVAEQTREFQRSPLALRPCSDCGQMVSRQASECPNCGRSFREASPTITYRGEQPIPVLLLFTILAVLFAVAAPLAVYFGVAKLAAGAAEEGLGGRAAFVATAVFVLSMIICAIMGGAVGRPRMAYVTGIFLGLFFGPLGVFAAYAIDKRPQCLHCFSRLNGLASECPSCHSRLTWKVETSWY